MYKTKKTNLVFRLALSSAILLALCWLALALLQPASAAPAGQVPIYTPTPGADGRIIYIVQANDTLLRISLISGVPVDELRGMNNLTGDTIYEGQRLLLGLAGPAEIVSTPGPTSTPTPILPTPSPKPGSGNLCVLLFEDRNGDALRQEAEPSLSGGAISINDRAGTISQAVDTAAGMDYSCFENLPEGEFSISAAVPGGYNPTTETSLVLLLNAGDETFVDFGAQANSDTQANTAPLPTENNRSPLLGVVGGLFLLGGVLLALFAARLLRGK